MNKPEIVEHGPYHRDKIYDFGADLPDCRYYVHEQVNKNGEWKTIKKYWR